MTIQYAVLADPVISRADGRHFEEAVNTLLNGAYRHLLEGNVIDALRLLNHPLTELWSEACAGPWADSMRIQCRRHPLRAVLHRDPYTKHGWTKPRGYPGDAVLMDYLYRNELPEGVDPLGRCIFPLITRAFTSMSVRYRRQLLRSLVDDTVALVPHARILCVAAGHARELEGSLVESGVFDGEFVAVDQDALSCAEIARANPGRRVRTLQLGVADLLRRKGLELGSFNLIYSAGLFDYLSDSLARRLTKYLLRQLRPGGRLLIANFVPETKGRGYMELFMDWHLVYRGEQQMLDLTQEAGGKVLRSFLDPHRNVVYVEATLERGGPDRRP
jgi:extracellular factor (EF) 3-hydroxypalmitic acid methyl ester biosynthesis protein